MLLFLSKIRKLSVREDNSIPESSTVTEIAISIENNFQSRKSMHAESYTLNLSAEESGKMEEECGYYVWRQKFPVKAENKVEKRDKIDEWVKKLLPGVYAFLPTEMITDFPFIIQADFLLSSSREAVLFDSPWNKGILECVPTAFMSAFVTLVKSTPDAPAMSLPSMFNFLPVNPSVISLLEPVRSRIKEKVLTEDIVPCESYSLQKIFCKASEVARLKPAFWTILHNAREFGVNLKNLSSHGTYILSSHFDKSTYDSVLKFLEVKNVDPEWYAKCIEGSNLVKEVDEQLYLRLLYFVAVNWQNYFSDTNMMSIPLLKCVNRNDVLSLWCLSKASQGSDRLCIASDMKYLSWLISWNKEFPSSNKIFVQPNTQSALENFSNRSTVTSWLQKYAKAEFVCVYSYGSTVVNSLSNAKTSVISFTHFLYHSDKKSHIDGYQLQQLCRAMPLIDSYGNVVRSRNSIMVPASGSKWVELMGINPWKKDGYIELSAGYKFAGHFAGNYTSEYQLLEFLKAHVQASDVPHINPPSSPLTSAGRALTRENVYSLLRHIRYLGEEFLSPIQLINSVKYGQWMKSTIGYRQPADCIINDSEWECLLKVFDGTPVIDYGFYGSEISSYKEELKKTGLIMRFEEASKALTQILKDMVSKSSLTKASVLALLGSYRQLRTDSPLPVALFDCMRSEKWLYTSLGFRSPTDAILFYDTWQPLSPIANLPFIDDGDYCHGLGHEIYSYKGELKELGVTVEVKNGARFVISSLSIPSGPSIMSKATVMSLLTCIKNYIKCGASLPKDSQDKICMKWVKTSMGYQCPDEFILFDAKKSSLCIEDGPFIDKAFYGSKLASFKDSLARIGVIVNVNCGQDLVARHLKNHKIRTTICRIYMYLMNCNWKPNDKDKSNNWIWIPKEPEDGEWVSSECCVLSDKNNLFRQIL
ncbi:hypothetical protein HU200_062869 [Digitaria exilis]|uniref:Uncharacterized protein n=1 Tax=Digitaria exilis TaxID=1010633 RepID=A0A835A9N1_9POAL|nr:hypothetical protein HU200_062869 [Digitaria exilis]